MKSVYIMINSLEVGGAEKSLVSFLNTIDLSKYKVYLQLINRNGPFESFIPEKVIVLPGISFFEFCHKSLKQQLLSRNISYLMARFRTGLSIRRNQKNNHILHDSQAFWKGASMAFEPESKEYDIAIAWGQGTPTHYVSSKIRAKKKLAWINADYEAVGHNSSFDYSIYKKYDYIVTVSDRLHNKMCSVFPDFESKIRTVYDINSAQLIRSMSEEAADDTNRTNTLNLCTVGRLVKPKGYDLAVDAGEELAKKGIDFCWRIIGDGPERSSIEQKIREKNLQDKIFLLGTKTNPYPYVKAADIYVQTSRSEGFCLTLTEARILHKLCVSTCFDVVYDQIISGKNGLIVDMNGKAVAEGILKLYEDDDLRVAIQRNLCVEKIGNEEEIEKIYQLMEGHERK